MIARLFRLNIPLKSSHRFFRNFVENAGFSPRTDNSNYSKNKLFLLEDGTYQTYSNVNRRSGQFASLFTSKYRIQRGDRILCRILKHTDSAAIYLAALRIGAVYVPLNPSYTTNETTHFINDSKPRLFISSDVASDTVFSDRVENILSDAELSKETNKFSPVLDVENVRSEEIACVLYTSGTTGKPKGAMISHGALSSNAETLSDFWEFKSDDVNLHSLPFYHIHGLLVSFHCTIFSKSTCIFLPKFTVPSTIKFLPKSSVFMGVPTYYSRLCEDEEFSGSVAKNVRLFISGSASLMPSVFEDFLKKSGKRICERYGMTETLVSTSNPVNDENFRLAGSAGQPIPGVKMRISQKGMVEVKSPALFSGYLNLPEKTKEEFTSDGFFITGDMGEFDKDGYLWIRGRHKDLIISGGLNVYPVEVETLLDSMDEVKESALIGVPHPDFGEAVVAVCELKDAQKSDSEKMSFASSVQGKLKKSLAPYKCPKRIIFVDELPRNHLGKVQKNILRGQFKALFS